MSTPSDSVPQGLARWAKITAVALAIVTSALLIAWVHLGAPGIDDLRVEDALLAPIPRPDIAALSGAQFVPASPPFWHTSRFGIARLQFDVPDPQNASVALYTIRARDNYLVYVNGALAAPPQGAVGERSTAHGVNPRLIRLLPAHLVPGKNTIDILSTTNSTHATLNNVYLGPFERLDPAYRHATNLSYNAGLVAAIGAGMVLLFALALSSVIRRPALLLTTSLVLLLTSINEMHTLWLETPWPFHSVYVRLTGIPLWVACAAFANEWTGGPAAYRKWFLLLAISASASVVVTFALYAGPSASLATSILQSLIGGCALVFMIQRMSRYYYAAPPSTAAEVFVACIGLIMALTLLATQSGALAPMTIGIQGEAFTKLATISLIVFIAVGLARIGVTIYQRAAVNNQALALKIKEKEQELEANHIALRDRDRERALHDERTRIMRDVHDGIGSQLLGLLLQARARTPKNEALTLGLQAAIDDLYLVVDSLDDIHGSLETALGTFRSRIEPKCAAASIEIVWQIEDIGNTKTFGPADILQIYRILHEALSAVLRRGGVEKLTFALSRDALRGGILLSFHDDSTGFDPSTQRIEHANMQQRAASIGARLDVTSGATGTCVNLLLPT